MVAVGTLLLLADAAYFRALALPGALVSVISALRRTNVVLSFALGAALFGERNRLPKAIALAGILLVASRSWPLTKSSPGLLGKRGPGAWQGFVPRFRAGSGRAGGWYGGVTDVGQGCLCTLRLVGEPRSE